MIDPSCVHAVPRELLEELAAEGNPPPASPPPSLPPPRTPPSSGSSESRSRLLVARWLTDRGVSFRVKPEPDGHGRTIYVLKACPFDASHGDPDSCVMQAADGKLSAQCFHNGCRGRGWQAFKNAIGPPARDHYDPPLTRPGRSRSPRPTVGRPPPGDGSGPGSPGGGPPPGAPEEEESAEPRPLVVQIAPEEVPVAQTMRSIGDVLLAAGDCYRRAGQLVRVTGTTITPCYPRRNWPGC